MKYHHFRSIKIKSSRFFQIHVQDEQDLHYEAMLKSGNYIKKKSVRKVEFF